MGALVPVARLRGAAGVMLIEAAAVIVLILVVTATLAPTVTNALDDARLLRARHDLSTIAVGVARLVSHVWPDRHRAGGFSHFGLLVSPGRVARAGTPAATGWDAPMGSTGVGLLDDHLLANAAQYPGRQGGPASFGWRGPYLAQSVGPDPWGQRYAVNVGALAEPGFDTVVITAGPDGRADAPFARDGVLPAGDDLLLIVSPTGRRQ